MATTPAAMPPPPAADDGSASQASPTSPPAAAVARKAFDEQQAIVATETARLKEEAEARVAEYKKKADDWYEAVAQPNLTKATSEATKAAAEKARLLALVASSQDEGLRKV